MKSLAVLSSCLALASAAAVDVGNSYEGYKVVRLSVGDQVEKVNHIISSLGLETWKGAPRANAMADIVVPPGVASQFDSLAGAFPSVVMHENLAESIANETNVVSLYAAGAADDTWFNNYHPYADHVQFLRDLQASFSSNSEIVTVGNSLQNRPITGIHFWGSAGKNQKPAVVLHGTVHAREWIGTMVVEYFAYSLINGYKASNAELKAYVDKYDFYIIPVVNPDGFVYTQTNDRLWRKNRQTTSGSTCLGHDINRNWPHSHWGDSGGASTNPCAQDYKGTSAGSAPETKAHAAFLQNIKNSQGLKLYIDYHSYSQLFMSPYGWSCTALPANNNEYQSLLAGAVAAIKRSYGTEYEYGPICSTIYKATGSSVDYVLDNIKADYSLTSELRDTGNYGFVLPANQIRPSGIESFDGFKYLLANMK